MFQNNEKMYSYPLHESYRSRDLREMIERSASLYAEENAFLLKDPVALRELDPRSEAAINFRINPDNEYRGITYRQVNEDRKALGSAMLDLGISKDDKVIILAETRYEWYITYLATVCGLAIIAPMDKELPANEVENLINRSGANTIFYSRSQEDKLLGIADNIKQVKNLVSYDLPTENSSKLAGEDKDLFFLWDLINTGNSIRANGNTQYDNLPIDPRALAVLLFTSGTTAKSKAVMLCHDNLCVNIYDVCLTVEFDKNDTLLSVLPLHHTFEATAGFLLPLSRGGKIAMNDGLRHIAKNLQQSKTSILIAVPLLLETLHKTILRKATGDAKVAKKYKLGLSLAKALNKIKLNFNDKIFAEIHKGLGGHLRLLVCGGAAIEPQILADFNDWGITAIQGYGVTECSPIISNNRPKYKEHASAGLPTPHVEVKIINEDENGIGEIIARGPNVMLGYYEDPEKTAEAIDSEGFYHTGDYGYIDDRGFIYITGRKANIIVTKNGKNIFPEEIEFVLLKENIIEEVVVYGERDEYGEQIITAEVFPSVEELAKVLETNAKDIDTSVLTGSVAEGLVKDAISKANKELQNFKKVKDIVLRAEPFPRNTSKKILRNKEQRNV
ncbi:AMP-dependent synthetase/ligase [Fastidiosipila sanguinis]|uniref:AMP-dependent synthetase n=1 Tax=Fastidiosipila sanguinis TaxID=236753 RepID=A0A2S0KP13_9FIRM|nr:AMP-binding protein [Fastidiosipila sanguinis]AVM42763.1 AMP-dependent synthetase [Fastidiosipila sanguinis]